MRRFILILLLFGVILYFLQKMPTAPIAQQVPQTPAAQITGEAKPQVAPDALAVPNAPVELFAELVWAYDLAKYAGNDNPSIEILAQLIAWKRAENTAAAYNPLATTQPMPGSSDFNSVHVQNYTSYEQGLQATVLTLHADYPGYSDILQAILTNDPQRLTDGIAHSPWGTNADNVTANQDTVRQELADALAPRTIQAVAQPVQGAGGKKCPYTVNNNEFQDGFWAGGPDNPVAAWAGQYGGYHLGVDFTGHRGDGVLAPWDATVIGIGEYGPGYTAGKYVVLDFGNGIFEYAGHLIDVYVSDGQHVNACDTIGTLGATDFPHTHITLRYSGAACENGVPNQPGGCIDPIEYWNTH